MLPWTGSIWIELWMKNRNSSCKRTDWPWHRGWVWQVQGIIENARYPCSDQGKQGGEIKALRSCRTRWWGQRRHVGLTPNATGNDWKFLTRAVAFIAWFVFLKTSFKWGQGKRAGRLVKSYFWGSRQKRMWWFGSAGWVGRNTTRILPW